MKDNSISVCLATYNGSKYLKQQLSSILNQLRPYDEIIISDDSSDDDTLNIIYSYKDPRIKTFTNQTFRNPISNFENAIKHASNPYIYLCDQDDVWLPNKILLTQQAFLDTGADLILSDCKVVDSNLNIIYESYRSIYKFKPGKLQSFLTNPYLGCCMAFRRDTLTKILPFPKFIPMHDIWIGIICEFYYKVSILDMPLILYRRHGNNATPYTASGKSKNSLYKKSLFRLNMIRGLLVSLFR